MIRPQGRKASSLPSPFCIAILSHPPSPPVCSFPRFYPSPEPHLEPSTSPLCTSLIAITRSLILFPSLPCSAHHELAALSTGKSPPLIWMNQYHDSQPNPQSHSLSDVVHLIHRLTNNRVQVNAHDEDDLNSYPSNPSRSNSHLAPSSPPPSFHSRSSSPSSRRLLNDDSRRAEDADQTLADAFDDGSDSEAENEPDDRQRLMRANPEPRSFASGSDFNNDDNGGGSAAPSSSSQGGGQGQQDQTQQQGRGIFRRLTILPSFTPSSSALGRVIGSNDGVFANLAAKPERGEKNEDLPPVGFFFFFFFSIFWSVTDP